MPLTLKEAAKATGKDRTTLLRAIKSGRMSATRSDDGGYLVDPAELARVYQVDVRTPNTHDALHKSAQPFANSAQVTEVALLRELLEEVRGERDELRIRLAGEVAERERLLRVIEEQASTVKLLTHQPTAEGLTPKDKATYWRWFLAAAVLTVLSLAAAPWFWPILRQEPITQGHGGKTPQASPGNAEQPKPTQPVDHSEPWKPDNGS